MGLYNKYWQKYKKLYITSIGLITIESFCDLMQPQFLALIIDEGITKSNLNLVLKYSLFLVLITAIGACFAFFRNITSTTCSQNFGADLRNDLFEKILSLPIAQTDKFDGGSLITRLTNDVTQLVNFVNGSMRIILKAPIMFIGCIILAIKINYRTAPIIAFIVVLVSITYFFSMKLSFPVFLKVQNSLDNLNTTAREFLTGIRLVRAFNRSDFETEKFKRASDDLAAKTLNAHRILSLFSPLTNIITNCSIVFILIYGYSLVREGNMRVGEIVAFIAYMSQILTSLSLISSILNIFVRTKSSYNRINEVLSNEHDENAQNNKDDDQTISFEQNAVKFDNVSFSYPEATGEMALKNLNFEIKRGETLGIIGPTGSGKTTLAALVLGFYEISCGDIYIGDKNTKHTSVKLIRDHIAYVPQKPMLFSGTIKQNILWSKNNENKLVESAKQAFAYEFIQNTKDGFDTLLGQGGVNLSGGQKQRLSIARALSTSPKILILDDATSALDAITESRVQNSLKQFDGVVILITQRISTVKNADKILVLDNGKQAGLASHEELIKHCDCYKDIYYSQVGGGKNEQTT